MCPSILASHLGGPFHHLAALVAPIFLWVGYPPHPISTIPTLHIHAHPLWPTQPPPRLHAHLHTLPHTSVHLACHFFPGFFLHPLHFLCPGTLPSLSHGPWVGKFFFLGKTPTCCP